MEKQKFSLKIKRVYDAPASDDGLRILVDRLWPRGLTRQRAEIGLWLKEIAPTAALRQAFGHDTARWNEFRARYRSELDYNSDAVSSLRSVMQKGPVTLLYGARDEAHNNAVVLQEYLGGGLSATAVR